MSDARNAETATPAAVHALSTIPSDVLQELAATEMSHDLEEDGPLLGGHTD